jgi:hypothetical protein
VRAGRSEIDSRNERAAQRTKAAANRLTWGNNDEADELPKLANGNKNQLSRQVA